MKATLPIFALVTLLSTQAFGAFYYYKVPSPVYAPVTSDDVDRSNWIYYEEAPSKLYAVYEFSNGVYYTANEGYPSTIKVVIRDFSPTNKPTTTYILPDTTSVLVDNNIGEIIFRTPTSTQEYTLPGSTTPITGDVYQVLTSSGTNYHVITTDTGTYIDGRTGEGTLIDEIITENLKARVADEEGSPYVISIGKYEELEFPDGSRSEVTTKDNPCYVVYLPSGYSDEELKEALEQLPQSDTTDEATPTVIVVELPKKPVVVHPTLAVHNVFRNNMVSVLNRIKPHQTVRSDQEFYVQSFKGSKASRIESTTSELNSRVYIESSSLYSNVKNKETLRQTGGTVGFDYENIGFCFSDLTGELNQYDLDSRLYSVYAGFGDQHKVVLSYGDHDLGNFDGDSYGALYEFNYDNFVADVAYTNTKFDQENLKTYMVGVGYSVSGNVVGPVNGSIKGMVIQDFGDHKDQYGAKQGSTGILVSGMLQTNITNNLGVYLMASGEVRRHATGASAALGLECAF